MSSRRGVNGRDVYCTTQQLNLGDMPLLSRRPSPAVSVIEEQLQQRAGEALESDQRLQPQQQRLLTDYPPPSRDMDPPPSKDTDPPPSTDTAGTVSAASTSSIADDRLSPVDAAVYADDDDDDYDDYGTIRE